MTIVFPKPSAGDKILALLGKRRAIFIPDIYNKFGIYAYGRAVKEPFLHALTRNSGKELAAGWFFLDEIMPQVNDKTEMEND